MKDGVKWYPRFPLTFLGGIQGLSAKDIAVYSVVLDLIYQHGGRINNDPRWVSGWISDMGPSAVRTAIKSLASRGLLTIGEGWIGNELAEVYSKTDEKLSGIRRESGRKGGQISAERRADFGAASNKNNDLAQASASPKSREDKSSDTSYPHTPHTPQKTEVAKSDPPPATGPASASAPASARVSASAPVKARASNASDPRLSIAFQHFVSTAQRIGWPVPKILTPDRAAKLRGRIEDAGGIKGWVAAVDRAASSPFLRGEGSRDGWRADFDFLLSPAKFARLMEGSYDRGREEHAGRGAGAERGETRNGGRSSATENMVDGFRRAAQRGRSPLDDLDT